MVETEQTLELVRATFLGYFNPWPIWSAAENVLLGTCVISFAGCSLSLLLSFLQFLLLPSPLFLHYLFNRRVDLLGCPRAILGWMERFLILWKQALEMLVVVIADEKRSLRARFLPSFPAATEGHEQALWSSRVGEHKDVSLQEPCCHLDEGMICPHPVSTHSLPVGTPALFPHPVFPHLLDDLQLCSHSQLTNPFAQLVMTCQTRYAH